jgi:hypothetical protein
VKREVVAFDAIIGNGVYNCRIQSSVLLLVCVPSHCYMCKGILISISSHIGLNIASPLKL